MEGSVKRQFNQWIRFVYFLFLDEYHLLRYSITQYNLKQSCIMSAFGKKTLNEEEKDLKNQDQLSKTKQK